MKSKLSLVLRTIAAVVFLYAGWQKMGAPQEFADSIAAYQLVPTELINLVAMVLPPLELIVGCMLLIGWQKRVSAFSALILTGVFMVALVSAILRGLAIGCGCFGEITSTKGDLWLAAGRDFALGMALVWIYSREIETSKKAMETSLASEPIPLKSGEPEV
jgi:uncharacterized membrane protein YphA (DoxX/SURF4 family)